VQAVVSLLVRKTKQPRAKQNLPAQSGETLAEGQGQGQGQRQRIAAGRSILSQWKRSRLSLLRDE